jgi:DNA-binding response OmpR family regulator
MSGNLLRLAQYFAARRGEIVTREEIERDVLCCTSESNIANVYLSRFRKILGPQDELKTIYREGWVLLRKKAA